MSRNLILALMVLVLSTIAIPKASAVSVPPVFDLNNIFCNCLPAGSTDGGTVTLTQVSTTDVKFDVKLSSLLDFHFTNGFDGAFAFDYIGTAPISASFTTLHFLYSTTTNGKMDGAGQNYTQLINWDGSATLTG